MGIAVKESKHRHKSRSRHERQTSIQRHQHPEHHPRDGNPDLHPWQGQPQHPHQSAEGHHHRERQRQDPECRSTQNSSPQPDGNHRHDVIEPRDGVQESRKQTSGSTAFHVSAGSGNKRHHQTQHQSHTAGHRQPPG